MLVAEYVAIEITPGPGALQVEIEILLLPLALEAYTMSADNSNNYAITQPS